MIHIKVQPQTSSWNFQLETSGINWNKSVTCGINWKSKGGRRSVKITAHIFYS